MADLHINNKNGWNEDEDDIIKKYYPSNGANEVIKYLKNRELRSIQQRAQKLGVKYLTYNQNYFDEIDSPTKSYWLGFLYADGYTTSDNRWGIELCYEDINHMTNLLKEIEYSGNIRTRERSNNKSCSILINNSHMTNSLITKGVIPNKTQSLVFPTSDMLPDKYLSDFVRGFFDGDGCVYYKYNTKPRKDRNNKIYTRLSKEISFVCKSDSFINDMFNLLSKNNIYMKLGINKQNNNLNVLRTAKSDDIKMFYKYIYKNSNPNNRLERKYNKFNELFIATSNSDVSKKIS